MRDYHDSEWGRPSHDEKRLFEMLILEGMQAGLSWRSILLKRETMREAFDRFDPEVMAAYTQEKVEELLGNPGIIRNRRKVEAARQNARAYLALCEECGSLDRYIWSFVSGTPIVNRWASTSEIPAMTDLSEKISKDLKRRGFQFVGPTIIYAYMQSVGVVNDHLVTCPWHEVCCQAEVSDT